MKKLYFLLLIAIITSNLQFLTSNCYGQYVAIPDSNFVKWLQANPVLTGCMSGNLLDTTCSAVLNKKTIDCSADVFFGGAITNLTGIQYFKNLDSLICFNNLLQWLPTLPPNLEYLDCSNNFIDTILPTLPQSLIYLNCSGNTPWIYQGVEPTLSLPDLPEGLEYLNCSQSLVFSLPTIPPFLQYLDFGGNGITSLTALPSSLTYLDCSGNNLTHLPTLINTALTYLDCSQDSIDSIPALPNTLQTLYCWGDTLITSLPSLPNSLTYLNCSNDHILILPILPASLYILYCDYNRLTNLPQLKNVGALECGHNFLTSLPTLSPNIDELECSHNNLSSLPALRPTMTVLQLDSNKLLTCLPAITTFTAFYASNFNISGTSITCLPNHISHPDIASIPAMDTMPLCGLYNPNGCYIAAGVTGNIGFDSDNNCNTTVGEPTLGLIKVKLFDSTGINLLQQVYSNGDGAYSLGAHLGKYIVSIDTAGTPFYVLCPDSNIHHSTLVVNDSLDYNANFRLVCKNGYDLGVNSINYISGKFFPGKNASVTFEAGDFATYYGVSCYTTGLTGTVVAVISGPITISSASGNGIISGNSITWNVADFSKTNFSTAFSVVLNTNTNAQAGDAVCMNVTVTGGSGTDNNLSNNNLTQCYTVINSYDPNFKEVYPSSTTNPGEWLTYTIHFQNTGTAAAQNIYLLDTIDNNLDISTIQVLSQSNKAFIQVLPGRIVRFNFPNIFLPDSTHSKDSSTAYVQYRIKTNSSIAPNTTIKNTASVYFDYNKPVQTNTAVSTFQVTTGIKQLKIDNGQLTIYPNPTNGVVNIVLPKKCDGCVVNVTDVTGRTFKVLPHWEDLGGAYQLDFSGLSPGVYFIRISNATETQTVKAVKQ